MKNATIFQFFHWYYPDGGKLWQEVAERAEHIGHLGINYVWLPPAYKGASGGYSVGYDTYDLFDLGEFDQKGTRATKYGDKEGLLNAINRLKEMDIKVLFDVVFNHKMGADEKEPVSVHKVNPENRTEIDEAVIDAQAYTRFTFPGRNETYSSFLWDKQCFSGVDHIEDPTDEGIFKIINDYSDEGWNTEVDDELGNFDYLMGADIDFRNPAVMGELMYWGEWLLDTLPIDGFRLDAVKHIPAWFFKQWIQHVQNKANNDLLIIAEYWSPNIEKLQQYLERVDGSVMLFDVALHHKFHEASNQGEDFDLTQVFSGTLIEADPMHTITLVANHDTQPLQSLEAPVEPWFKPLAYALILIREQGIPCVFYPDLFGASYEDTGDDGEIYQIEMPIIAELEKLIQARTRFAHGAQIDYFDDKNCIAFVRSGTEEDPGCVVVLSNGAENEKIIQLGEDLANKEFADFLGNHPAIITTDDRGEAAFPVNGGSVSLWVQKEFCTNME
ncbi:TPA: alpha-amylase [Yersinia enterocolitica]|nr:alpha-amylase [Yersinia enterocolitica]HDL7822632.1 alpha-amylase [Yersinia enterocolitica]HDL7830605.1 alpha-amylase [Yersinia enterocolitica]HDL7871461.1 alpha-amylase [Yersinia enterocolitica]HDL7883989.1 alpha-amylase [Yersinia enterocolitica]